MSGSRAFELPRRWIRALGYDIVRAPRISEYARRRAQMLAGAEVDLVLDVGANRGQYGRELRTSGYGGEILSFEPLSDAFDELREEAAGYRGWEASNLALGAQSGKAKINVSRNSVSSSLLPMVETHQRIAPESRYVTEEVVTLSTLDEVAKERGLLGRATLLKLDVQGYEQRVLAGAERTLRQVRGVEIEASLVPLYTGGWLIHEVLDWAVSHGFDVHWIEPGLIDHESGRLAQCDLLLFRK